jgi:hypothetical protein
MDARHPRLLKHGFGRDITFRTARCNMLAAKDSADASTLTAQPLEFGP